MKLHLHFILVNFDYNQSIADDYNDGEESEDNVKYLWEDELLVSEPVKSFKINHKEHYTLVGQFGNGEAFSFEIPKVSKVICETESGKKEEFAVSKKLIKSLEKVEDEENGEIHITFYLHDDVPMENPFEGLYIDKRDFPAQLLSK